MAQAKVTLILTRDGKVTTVRIPQYVSLRGSIASYKAQGFAVRQRAGHFYFDDAGKPVYDRN